MITLAWVLLILAVVTVVVVAYFFMDEETLDILFLIACIFAFFGVLGGGVWGLGYICGWWGPLW